MEESEIWRDFRKAKQEKRYNNLIQSTELLKANNVDFESKNFGIHLVINNTPKIYFYPSTGRWTIRGGATRRGVKSLLKYIERQRYDSQ